MNFNDKKITVLKGKSNKSRLVPLVQPLTTYLKLLQKENKADMLDYVLYNNSYNKISTTFASVLFRKYIKYNKLEDKGYTIHKCRHSFRTNLAEIELMLLKLYKY